VFKGNLKLVHYSHATIHFDLQEKAQCRSIPRAYPIPSLIRRPSKSSSTACEPYQYQASFEGPRNGPRPTASQRLYRDSLEMRMENPRDKLAWILAHTRWIKPYKKVQAKPPETITQRRSLIGCRLLQRHVATTSSYSRAVDETHEHKQYVRNNEQRKPSRP
jgi:hypothetical protein